MCVKPGPRAPRAQLRQLEASGCGVTGVMEREPFEPGRRLSSKTGPLASESKQPLTELLPEEGKAAGKTVGLAREGEDLSLPHSGPRKACPPSQEGQNAGIALGMEPSLRHLCS